MQSSPSNKDLSAALPLYTNPLLRHTSIVSADALTVELLKILIKFYAFVNPFSRVHLFYLQFIPKPPTFSAAVLCGIQRLVSFFIELKILIAVPRAKCNSYTDRQP